MAKRLIDLETGIYKDFQAGDGLRYSTNDSRAEIKRYYDSQKNKRMFKDHNDDLGGFIFMVYEMGKELNKHREILSQADLTRLIFIGTYTNYGGVLMETHKTSMSKKKLRDLVNLSRNKFVRFYNTLLDLGILLEREGKILMNESYFFKGSIRDHEAGVDSCTRIYIDTVRELFKSASTRSYNALGYLFRVIPYLNTEYNLVCHNPAEKIADDVKPMVLGELAEMMGYSSKNVDKLKRDLQSIRTKDGRQVVAFETHGVDKRTYKIIINPKVVYGGKDFKQVEVLTILFK